MELLASWFVGKTLNILAVAAPGSPYFLVDNFFLVDNNLPQIPVDQKE